MIIKFLEAPIPPVAKRTSPRTGSGSINYFGRYGNVTGYQKSPKIEPNRTVLTGDDVAFSETFIAGSGSTEKMFSEERFASSASETSTLVGRGNWFQMNFG